MTHSRTASNADYAEVQSQVAQGTQEPIKYVEYNGQKYIVDGNHRYMAARDAGMETIPAQRVKLPYKNYETPADLNYEYIPR